jgi:ribonuclease HI
MTPILLYITTYGHDERCGWCVVVVEPEGMFEEHLGVASNPHRAMLWALQTAFDGISIGEQVGIRTQIRSILNFENRLSDYQQNGWKEDDNQDILDNLLPKMFNCETKFVDATTIPQAGDSRSKSLAKQAHESYDYSFPEKEITFLSSSIEIQNPFLSTSMTEDVLQEEDIAEEDVSNVETSIVHIEIENYNFPNPDMVKPQESIEPKNIEQEETISKKPTETLNSEIHEMKITTDEKPLQSDIVETDLPQTDSVTAENNDTTSTQEEPKEDQTLLNIPQGSEYLFGARILAYVDGIGNGTLGAWSFVLIDRQTGWALLRAKGVTATTSNRMRLQACIEALKCLKQQSQTVEIRSRYRKLIQMGSSWMDSWKENDWKNSKKEDVSDLSFLVELDELRTQHKLSWQYIPYESDEQGIQEVTRLSKNALHNLNYGEFTDIESRIKNYPLHQII